MAKLWHPPTTYPGVALRAALLAGAFVTAVEVAAGPFPIVVLVTSFGCSFVGWAVAISAIPARPADRAKSAAEADRRGMAELTAFSATGRPLHADLAVRLFRHSLSVTPPDDPARARYLSHLATVLAVRFERTGAADDLDASIETDQLAIEAAPAGSVEQATLLADLSSALIARYQHLGRADDLARAIEAGRRAVEQTPRDHPSMVTARLNLAGALTARYERFDDLSDVDEAIDGLRQAAALCRVAGGPGQPPAGRLPAAHPAWAYVQANLAVALKDRFRRLGRPADIDAAVDAARAGLAAVFDGHPNQLKNLHAAGTALSVRFEVSGDRADLTEAIDLFQQCARRCPPGHPTAVLTYSALCVALRERYELDQRGSARASSEPGLADLDAAVDAGRTALRAAPDGHPHRAGCLTNLALALRERFELSARPADLDEALTAATTAVEITAAEDPDRVGYLSNLGGVLQTKARHGDEPADLDRAIEVVTEAVTATPTGRADRGALLNNLGMAVAERLERFGDSDSDSGGSGSDVRTVVASHRAAAHTAAAPAGLRVKAAWHWGKAAFDVGDHDEALTAFTTAVALLPQVAWHGLDDTTRQRQLTLWHGLASDAACTAIACGRPQQAVELLDQGRSVLWTQALQLRDDLDRLAEQAPQLHAELSRVRGELNRPLHSEAELSVPERRRLATRWDELVAQVRALPGFERLFRPVPYDELRRAAAGGPVVIVNISRYGCHALLVTAAGDPSVLPLPALTFDGVVEQAEILLGAVARSRPGDDRPLPPREADRHRVLDVLEWLWERVAEPVLTALGQPAAGDEPLPRLWWCPTGPLALLPLHAAGRHSRTNARPTPPADLVLGRVVSSYTPTLAALLRTRRTTPADDTRRATPRPPARLLAVGLERTPGQADLPAVRAELAELARLLPAAMSHRLTGSAATRAGLLAQLPRHPMLHLACHAVQDRVDPGRSAIQLWDGEVTVAQLAGLPTADRELAYLSACETATGGQLLADEALHLAGAMLLLGYRDVIATSWTIHDTTAPLVAAAFYAHHLGAAGAGTAPAEAVPAAVALHRAVAALRAQRPADPLCWAPYLHTGG
ncbi:CHAT domain-containing protein [Micromonospora sp. NBC_01813]|uniref:CHAT domain-containing protein n=1 Tax=Micromonospora sp. NBC_01813 TaxID=2975988 RepID=UPI002DD81214|nr:CHAT domain-containing protein [Micromonospora sp. NBC_01813]WSA12021.1 CHAT domain-containing protein [Micromonospora sp. NBC_01813]